MLKWTRFFLLLPLLHPIGGCTSNCTGNPRFDSLACAERNMAMGVYDRQIESLRAEEEDLRRRADALREDNARLAARQQRLRGQARALSQRLQALNQSTIGGIDALAQVRRNQRAANPEASRIAASLRSAQERQRRLNASELTPESEREIAALEQEVSSIRQQIAALSGASR